MSSISRRGGESFSVMLALLSGWCMVQSDTTFSRADQWMCVIEPATSEIGNGIALSIVFSNAKAADFVGIQSRQGVIYRIGVGAHHGGVAGASNPAHCRSSLPWSSSVDGGGLVRSSDKVWLFLTKIFRIIVNEISLHFNFLWAMESVLEIQLLKLTRD